MESSNTTLVLMGFDPDRAQLITSLLIAGVAAAVAGLVANSSTWATLGGLGGFAGLFGYTFAHQTRSAMKSTGVDGSFDPGGWILTLVALTTVGVISAWAGATLALAVRPRLAEAGSAIGKVARTRRPDRLTVARPLGVALVLVLLFVSVPVFGDLVNYTTDSRMLHGGPPPVGLIPGDAPAFGGTLAPSERPWLSWRPSGSGRVTPMTLPAPWADGSDTPLTLDVYTPPGFDPNGGRRYPVLYEAPFNYQLWDSSINFGVALDTLIDQGAIPPLIVVFINAYRAPMSETECADSVDGRQWFDRFISQTVVTAVDGQYPTIATGDGRAFTGFSQGGYCAAILALRHPTVFGTAIPMSGYFWAGAGSAAALLPFNGDKAALAAASPMIAATQLPAELRVKLFFIVVARPSQPFFGVQAAEFEHMLQLEGYSYLALDAQVPHGWEQVRQELPLALEAWAARLVSTGTI
jgi:hypothetical protein